MSTEEPGEPDSRWSAGTAPGAPAGVDLVAVGRVISAVEATLDEVERALARVDAGAYGRCGRCGADLPDEQLAAGPLADKCVPPCPD